MNPDLARLLELFLAPAVVGVVVGAGGSLLSVWLSLRAHRKEKWWEKRLAAFERIIEALHHLKNDIQVEWDAHQEGRQVSEDTAKTLRADWEWSKREVDKAIHTARFMLGETAQSRLKKYQKERTAASNASDWTKHLMDSSDAVDSCLTDLIDIAHQEVGRSA